MFEGRLMDIAQLNANFIPGRTQTMAREHTGLRTQPDSPQEQPLVLKRLFTRAPTDARAFGIGSHTCPPSLSEYKSNHYRCRPPLEDDTSLSPFLCYQSPYRGCR